MIELSLRWQPRDFDLQVAFVSTARNLALFGPSGSGKTSLLLAMAGLRRPHAGRIVLDGELLFDSERHIDVAAARRGLGVVFQDGRLFPHLRVKDNLLYGNRRKPDGSAIGFDTAVELLGLTELLARWPASLSGGEARRVAVGRAILSQPRALLLDEPLVGLHREARGQVLHYLRRLRDEVGLPTILVSHQPDEVQHLSQEVVLLDDGRVVGQVGIGEFAG
ncbi:molybdate transport system ATP-binding protein [Tahibacter aquaticus]|uniref:Molybdate transport system ATP-binding protein n=1 Tax=Tahibacter aquaticus TaxID=520092 RepID=A0A4R6Z9B0_9GAMM|nr:ATP-binding cassette domain-containing protein [Tahibacter aquaticus]TDR48498.1 molybdate transport system ATP-binding protein [Tahibacter aquaticus]